MQLSWSAGSEVVLEQGAQAWAVREGEEVTFQCRVTGGEMSNYWMSWYRKEQQEGFQGRLVGKVDSSNDRFTLRILRAELRDRAVYYCRSCSTERYYLTHLDSFIY
uniref:Ig-like domain-containing protein n=1 Tax=Gopherus evgoodei TaxID=1825980 RepID=A0A8C4WTH5_9SAUR